MHLFNDALSICRCSLDMFASSLFIYQDWFCSQNPDKSWSMQWKKPKKSLENFLIQSNAEIVPNHSHTVFILIGRLDNHTPISPYSTFSLSYRGLIATLGVLLTYIVVLMQFKSSDSWILRPCVRQKFPNFSFLKLGNFSEITGIFKLLKILRKSSEKSSEI